MDRLERADPYEESLFAMLRGAQAGLWTALPGIIDSYDPDTLTAVVQPTIQALVTAKDGSTDWQTLPLLLDCPVIFPSGGGAVMTFPIAKGDECFVVFSSRCIDAWWQSGGVQPQAELRMHDLSDGFVFVGPRSQVRKLLGVSTSTAQLRSEDGSTLVELDPTAQTLTLTAPGGVTINADVTLNGKLTASGIIKSLVDVVAKAISLFSHKHGGVQTGSGISGDPQ